MINMRVAIMQPYFFPYLGYFSLIKNTDKFIFLDTVQFIRHGWIERNRILKQNEGWLYIKVPIIKHNRETLIKDVLINNNEDWKNKIIAQLATYKKIAPNYYQILKLINEIFEYDFDNITTLNKIIIEKICNYLNINKKIDIFSQMDIKIQPAIESDEWALNICKAIGNVSEYWNPPGGKSFFNKTKYEKNNIKLIFQTVKINEYHQKRNVFESNLSIIDILMFNNIEEINLMLDNYIIE